MALSTTNYFDRVRGVDFSKLPEPLRKGHDMVKKVSPNDWAYYHQSDAIRRVVDQYFEKLDTLLAQQAPKEKAAPKPKKDSLEDRYRDSPVAKAKAKAEHEKKKGPKPPSSAALRQAVTMLGRERIAELLVMPMPQLVRLLVQFREQRNNLLPGTYEAHVTVLDARTANVQDAEWEDVTPKPAAVVAGALPKESRVVDAAARKAGRITRVNSNRTYSVSWDHPTRIDLEENVAESRLRPETEKDVQAAKRREKTAAKKAATAAAKAHEPKRTKVKKHGNQNLRQPVSHFDGDLTLIRQFLSITKGEVTRKRVKALHTRIEKAIVSRKVRKTSPHAGLITDIATLVKKAYAVMVDKNVEKVGELKFSDKSIVRRAQAAADQVVIQSSVPLLSRFIGMQGTKPEAQTVATLLKAMEKQRRDVPGDDYAGPLSAAVAVLQDWKPGTAVRITQHQLSGLNGLLGLGCPGEECSCSGKK